MSGFAVPQMNTVNSVFKTHATKPGFLTLDEFTRFVTDLATGKAPDEAKQERRPRRRPSEGGGRGEGSGRGQDSWGQGRRAE